MLTLKISRKFVNLFFMLLLILNLYEEVLNALILNEVSLDNRYILHNLGCLAMVVEVERKKVLKLSLPSVSNFSQKTLILVRT